MYVILVLKKFKLKSQVEKKNIYKKFQKAFVFNCECIFIMLKLKKIHFER